MKIKRWLSDIPPIKSDKLTESLGPETKDFITFGNVINLIIYIKKENYVLNYEHILEALDVYLFK